MSSHIYRCNSCNTYTLKEICPNCSNKTINPKPAKYSLEDKYGIYRRKARIQHELEDKKTE